MGEKTGRAWITLFEKHAVEQTHDLGSVTAEEGASTVPGRGEVGPFEIMIFTERHK